jgi:hypothetical protein
MPGLDPGIHSVEAEGQHECYGMDRMVKTCDDDRNWKASDATVLDRLIAPD